MNHKKRLARAKQKAQHQRYARHYRKEEGTDLPWSRTGNRDFGCPYRGKDRFSGQWKKYADRSFKYLNEDGQTVTQLVPYNNNKY